MAKLSGTALKGFYNLAFGDKNLETGEIDDTVISNNGDSEQVVATVISAVYALTDREQRRLGLRHWKYQIKNKTLQNRNYKIPG